MDPDHTPANGSASEDDVLTLRLYVAGEAPNSVEARANLAAMLEQCEGTRYSLEVIDFLRDPKRAFADGVVVTPTLVKLTPPPVRKIIGTLRETLSVLTALGIGSARHA